MKEDGVGPSSLPVPAAHAERSATAAPSPPPGGAGWLPAAPAQLCETAPENRTPD